MGCSASTPAPSWTKHLIPPGDNGEFLGSLQHSLESSPKARRGMLRVGFGFERCFRRLWVCCKFFFFFKFSLKCFCYFQGINAASLNIYCFWFQAFLFGGVVGVSEPSFGRWGHKYSANEHPLQGSANSGVLELLGLFLGVHIWTFLFVYCGFPHCFQGGIHYAAASDLGHCRWEQALSLLQRLGSEGRRQPSAATLGKAQIPSLWPCSASGSSPAPCFPWNLECYG